MSPLSNRPLQPPKPPSSQHHSDEWATNVQNSAIDGSSSETADPASSEAPPPVAQRPLMRPVRPAPPPAVSEPKAPESVVTAPPTQDAVTPDATPAEAQTQTELDGLRQQPIPAPSEPMQYRAIGLLRGRYKAEDEQFTRGTLTTTDGTDIQAVLLGRVMSLVRNHLDLEQDHLWVVYPRTREKEQDLHAQIVGVWEPEKLNKPDSEESTAEEPTITYQPSSEVDDDYFSIRGEVIFQSPDDNSIVVKIQQAPRKKDGDRIKSFKLKLEGTLTGKVVGYFWDLQVRRQGDNLVIHQSAPIGMIPPKKRSKFDRDGDRPPRRDSAPRPGGSFNRSSRPTSSGTASSPTPVRKDPLPKPVVKKRDQVTEG